MILIQKTSKKDFQNRANFDQTSIKQTIQKEHNNLKEFLQNRSDIESKESYIWKEVIGW